MVIKAQHFTFHFEFTSPAFKAKLKPWSNRVLKEFTGFPALRLLCFFDDDPPEWLQRQFGGFTGIHTPIIGSGTWPRYVSRHFFKSDGGFAYDDLIYIPKTPYIEQEVPFVIVFAHELQHFIQRGFMPKISKANALLLWNLVKFDPTTELKPWDLPNNRDAMIVAARVAEAVCGRKAVKDFVQAQIEDGKKTLNISKTQLWQWVSTLKSSSSYDLLNETNRLVQKYKLHLQDLKSDIDFSRSKWWL